MTHHPYLIHSLKRSPQILLSLQIQSRRHLGVPVAFPEKDSLHWDPPQQTFGLKHPKILHYPTTG